MLKLTTVESAKSVRFNSNTTSDTHEVDNPEEFQFRLPCHLIFLRTSVSATIQIK
jgi:hypothetical protein